MRAKLWVYFLLRYFIYFFPLVYFHFWYSFFLQKVFDLKKGFGKMRTNEKKRREKVAKKNRVSYNHDKWAWAIISD